MPRSRFMVTLFAALVVALAAPLVTVQPTTLQAAEVAPSRDLRVAVVGDSLSAGRSGFLGNGLDDESWMSYAQGDGIVFAGGWARAGATPDEMAAAVRPVGHVDVLVILAGTNAVRLGRSLHDERQAYERIVETIGASEVVVADIPPYRWKPEEARTYSRELRMFVASRGWRWVDPWGWARSGSGWADGVSSDGTHPADADEYERLGAAFRAIILGNTSSSA
ncbi:SGNH/GDSL hydrolase family protein [Curtobacterium sp. MCBA15_009]|uniref:SGNH/GDSL hydrolase family protein n=1 Tax=Curtobacterium sp. MCBA15_009 TaxID=1898737 RepID=UPI000AB2BE77|nr:SGNH/GDSL hydrolase family protein [Curtobacterium sp. MCBA15_009]